MIHIVILADGRGTRFWLLRRETWPKQMLNFSGEGTLLCQTIRRLDWILRDPQHIGPSINENWV